MFKWFKRIDPESSGLRNMQRHFGEMLVQGRHMFDAAANAFLGGTSPEVIHEDLFATDRKINELERRIRREVVIHGTVHGPSELPACLVMMSIVKDAERIGDYCKNVYDLAAIRQKERHDEYYPDLVSLKDKVSHLLGEAKLIYDAQDEAKAKDFLRRGDKLQEHCDTKVEEILKEETRATQSAATVLAYRYYKRVVAHTLNIITSIVAPIDQLDFLDEDTRTRAPKWPKK